MDNDYGSYASQPPELSNNPFIEQSSVNRFPDINSISPQSTTQYASWLAPQYPGDIGVPQNYSYNPQSQLQQQQYPGWNPSVQQPGPVRQQFQPSSSFGQQLSTHLNGGGNGYMNPSGGITAPQQQSFTGYPLPQPQHSYNQAGYPQQPTGYQNYGGSIGMPQPEQQLPQQSIANYLSEFDPYASIGQGWDGPTHNQYQTIQQPPYAQRPPSGQDHLHPREFIRKYKSELEAWDGYSWKQMQNAFDALKDSWERRMRELEGRLRQVSTNWGMGAQQEYAQGQQLLKDAESKFSSVAASSFQMKEVMQGYRHSADAASKRRVREAMNAALQNLPDWPPLQY